MTSPLLSLRKPSDERAVAAERKVKGGVKRLVAKIPAHLHTKLKLRALEDGVTLQQLLVRICRDAGIE